MCCFMKGELFMYVGGGREEADMDVVEEGGKWEKRDREEA